MDKKEFTVSEVIDSIGISSHTWVVFVILGFAMIFDGYDFMIVNSTNLFVAHTFWPDNANPGALMGSLTTWGLLGMVLGGAYVTHRIMVGAVNQDHGARLDPLEFGKADRGGANNIICPTNTTSKHCAGEVTNGFLVGVRKADMDELRRRYPEAFERKFDPATGIVVDEWIIEGGND